MKVRLVFNVDDETRLAVARELDGKKWDGKRKATAEEVAGKMADGAEMSINECVRMFEIVKDVVAARKA